MTFHYLKEGTADGQTFAQHVDTWLTAGSIDVGEDMREDEIKTRIVVWLPSPFALLVAHRHWHSLATIVVYAWDPSRQGVLVMLEDSFCVLLCLRLARSTI